LRKRAIARTLLGMHLRTLLAALAAALAIAAPAYAQEPIVCEGVGESTTSCSTGDETVAPEETVGEGQVITEPADEVDPKEEDDEFEAGPKRGELHVLGGAANASSGRSAAAQQSSELRTATATAPEATGTRRAAGGETLPFTGVNGAYLALAGMALLATGFGLRRAAAA
jgi:hypothetical protein